MTKKVKELQIHDKDTGSSEVQIAQLTGKIGSIFREKNQTKQVTAGLECGITLKDFADFQKKDIIEVYNATITERTI